MEPEIVAWITISAIGLLVIPIVGLRRSQEWAYYQAQRGALRRLLLLSRISRTAILSLGILMASGVALIVVGVPPSDDRRTVTILMLVAEYACIVAALWSDEYWAQRIDRYTPKGE